MHVLAVTTINWQSVIAGAVAILAAVFHGRWGTKQQLDSIAVIVDGALTQAVADVKALQGAVAHLEGMLTPTTVATAPVPVVVVERRDVPPVPPVPPPTPPPTG